MSALLSLLFPSPMSDVAHMGCGWVRHLRHASPVPQGAGGSGGGKGCKMSEEAAKALAEAMNRLASAIENLPRNNGLMPGISIQHHGLPSYQQPQYFTRDHWQGVGVGGNR